MDSNRSRTSLLIPRIQKDHIAGMENNSYYFQKYNKLWSNPLECLFFLMLRKQFYLYRVHLRISLPKLMRVPIMTCLWYTSYIFVVKKC